MHIGVPAETLNQERRVALTPAGVRELTQAGHTVSIQAGAGLGSGITDQDYEHSGGTITDAAGAWNAELVLKVKEPTCDEFQYLRADQAVFAYLHLAANSPLVEALVESQTTAIAYETVQLPDRSLPLLAPMSEIAGRMAAIVGSYHLFAHQGGSGLLAPGVPGVRPAKFCVIGGGQAGLNAVNQAVAMGAEVTVLDLSLPRLRYIDELYRGRVKTVASNSLEVERAVLESDVVIGAVLLPGARTPRLVSHELVMRMRPGSVFVDIAVDQGGVFEDSRPTTHQEPTYTVGETVFYCVSNMPGAVPATSTSALTNATLPYIMKLANLGIAQALESDEALNKGLAVSRGNIIAKEIAELNPELPAKVAGKF